ncbi:Alpha/Beta hydrolase protein [Neurospora tetraspora]|uniref:Alpha/Beta hydrolase protein n=1 Tax=Neurospora tetraspora TaxID=94610 RepID=A0AAE0MKK6_9PEZI|nr:Alpha/Beta hydrolase protein [Neurospora tetraspora]
MPRPHHTTTFTASDGALLTLTSSLPISSPDPSYIPTSPILTFTGPTATTTAGTRARSASKASVIAEEGPNYSRLILLLHGFSGSSEYFERNFRELGERHWVVAWDMRGHGGSGLRRKKRGKKGVEGEGQYESYEGGYHVARLAVDLKNMLDFLKTSRLGLGVGHAGAGGGCQGQGPKPPLEIVGVGCSIGAAILWTYVELFTDADFSGFVFVDQAPLQDRSMFGEWDETKANKGCYDEKTMLGAQAAWNKASEDRHATHLALLDECLGYRFHPLPTDQVSEEEKKRDEAFFTAISAQCPSGAWLARLIADHTRYDHREACEGITKPVVVMGGKRSGCFSLEGMEEVVKRCRRSGNEKAEVSWYESGHWLFWEEAERFNGEVLEFARRCWSE